MTCLPFVVLALVGNKNTRTSVLTIIDCSATRKCFIDLALALSLNLKT